MRAREVCVCGCTVQVEGHAGKPSASLRVSNVDIIQFKSHLTHYLSLPCRKG